MHTDILLLLLLIIGAVVLLAWAVHSAARFASAHSASLGMPEAGNMSASARRVLGSICLALGGLWCVGLPFLRVDPPGVPGGSILMASSLLALGINLLGKSAASASRREAHWRRVALWLSVAIWTTVTVALVSWHTLIVRVRTSKLESAGRRATQRQAADPTPVPAALLCR
jgi:hypothetical protein